MEIKVQTSSHTTITVQIDIYPDQCPFCKTGIQPKYLFGYHNIPANKLGLSFMCPKLSCCEQFIGEYTKSSNGTFYFKNIKLGAFRTQQFSKEVEEISEGFITIYNQAEAAESYDLDQISGVGYRKALEFLIKDYIIKNEPTLKEKVENKLLGRCIIDHIPNDNIKNISKRAVWLGNDETHYVRRWENKTIQDLKLLIALTVHWIETEELTARMIEQMPD